MRGKIASPHIDVGCDVCNWFFTIWSNVERPVRFYAGDRTREGTGHATKYAFEFTCSYDQFNRYKAKRCKAVVDKMRYGLNAKAEEVGEPLHQYYNTPSCHDLPNERPFWER